MEDPVNWVLRFFGLARSKDLEDALLAVDHFRSERRVLAQASRLPVQWETYNPEHGLAPTEEGWYATRKLQWNEYQVRWRYWVWDGETDENGAPWGEFEGEYEGLKLYCGPFRLPRCREPKPSKVEVFDAFPK